MTSLLATENIVEYRFDTGGKPLKEIYHPDICERAAFRLDMPLHCTINDVFVLRDGQWFMGNPANILLEGRWTLPIAPAIAEKDWRKTNEQNNVSTNS